MKIEGTPHFSTIRVVQRRSILLGALAGATAITLATISEPAHAAKKTDMARIVFGKDDMFVPTPDNKVFQAPRLLGGSLGVEGSNLPAGARIVVQWDDRLYELGQPRISRGSVALKAKQIGKPELQDDGRTRAVFQLEEQLTPAPAYDISFGSGRTRQYPKDIINDPLPTILSVENQGKDLAKSTASDEIIAKQEIWGVTSDASWLPEQWGNNGYHTWRPDFITLRSVGPDPLPAGTQVRLQLDRRVFQDLKITPMSGPSGKLTEIPGSGNLIGIAWKLPVAVAAGERLTLEVKAAFVEPLDEMPTLENPLVSVHGPSKSKGQRSTGQESATRLDSAFSAETSSLYKIENFPLYDN